jgi:hypothetical protein
MAQVQEGMKFDMAAPAMFQIFRAVQEAGVTDHAWVGKT